jgi:type II secretory pathway component PulM
MKLDIATVGLLMQAVQLELQQISATIRDKGFKRFQRGALIAGVVVLAAYRLLYVPPATKLAGLQQLIDKARTMSQISASYREVRAQLRGVYAQLPAPTEKDHFLVDAIVESLKAEGLTSDSIRPPEETAEAHMTSQRLQISLDLRFPDLVGWLARVEASKPLLHVYSLNINKSRRLGYCTAQVGVGTLIPSVDLTR